MPTLAQVRTRANTVLADLWTRLVAKQAAVFARRGRYWEGILTHSIIPAHTTALDADALADRLAIRPRGEDEGWDDLVASLLDTPIACAIEVHAYGGPQGQGFMGRAWVRYNGNLYVRSRQSGPETSREHDWIQVTEEV